MAFHQPCAVIDIVEVFDGLRFYLACASNRRARYDAPRKGTRIHACRVPLLRNAARHGESLGVSALGQGQVLPAAKARGVNAFDMAVSNQDDLGQGSVLSVPIQACLDCSLRMLNCEIGLDEFKGWGSPANRRKADDSSRRFASAGACLYSSTGSTGPIGLLRQANGPGIARVLMIMRGIDL
jgi:hypothetical protein